MTTTSQKGFKIGPPMPDIEGGSKIPQALNNPVHPSQVVRRFSLQDGRKRLSPIVRMRREWHLRHRSLF